MPDLEIPDWLAWFIVVGIAFGSARPIGRFFAYIRLPYLVKKIMTAIFEPLSDMLADRVQEMIDRSVQPVWHELRPNQSTSLRDAVDRTEAGVKVLQSTIDGHISSVNAHASDPTAHMRPTDPDDGIAQPRDDEEN